MITFLFIVLLIAIAINQLGKLARENPAQTIEMVSRIRRFLGK